jgi:hypothetical protein
MALLFCQSPYKCGRRVPITVDSGLVLHEADRARLLNRIAAGLGFMTVMTARYCEECFHRSEAAATNVLPYTRARRDRYELLRIELGLGT